MNKFRKQQSLLGGGATVWWLTENKIIRDTLSRTGIPFLENKEDFEELLKDIPDAKDSKGKAIKKWCEENLDLSLVNENFKDKLPKDEKYCLRSKKISSGILKFKNFENIFNLLREKDGKSEKISGLTIAHLGDDPSQDSYYWLWEGDNIKEKEWTPQSSNRKRILARQLYIESQYQILETSDHSAVVGNKGVWYERAQKYYQSNEKIPSLERGRDGWNGITKNWLREKCAQYLRDWFDDEEKYNEAHKHFIKWCIKN